MIPTEVEELLGQIRKSVSRATLESLGQSAPHFVRAPGEPNPELTHHESLQAACAELRGHLAAFGSLPPSPPTLRGRVGLSFVRLTNRLFWWPVEASRRFAAATSEVARLQMEQQEQQLRFLIGIEKRLHAVETMLSRSALPRDPDGPRE